MYGEDTQKTADLIEIGEGYSREYQAASKKLAKLVPDWERRICEIASSAARLQALPDAFSHESPDLLSKALSERLRQQHLADVRAADAQIVPLVSAAEEAKQRLFKLNSAIVDAFAGYVGRIAPNLPMQHMFKVELEQTRKQIETLYLGSPAEIIKHVRKIVERIQGDPNIDSPVFRLPGVPAAA